LEAWKKAKNLNTSNAYQEYLRLFPNGEFKEAANAALRRLEAEVLSQQDDLAWEIAREKDTTPAYEKYLKDYPAGKHRAEANDAIKKLAVSDDGLVLVRGGTFQMGCTSEQQDCGSDEKPVHSVTLSDFYIGKYEVTQALWREVMGTNPSSFKDCDQCPVEQVSWEDVQAFLQKLNAKYPTRNYRLPTEAEWEYAAREGGKAVLFGNGKNILDPAQANFDASKDYKKPYSVAGTYRVKTTPVGTFAPNALGLYDMAGNVYEWCSDWYDDYPNTAQTNPTGSTTGTIRVLRGGSWGDDPQICRVAYRGNYTPSNRFVIIGFRLARTR
jgi:formylglycine-generating enzyme required for sulfatase activity